MLRILICIDGSAAILPVSEVRLVNDKTGTAETGNYNGRWYEAGEWRGGFRIENYDRSLGPRELARRALNEVKGVIDVSK